MRENMGLYRGKRKDNGEWVYGFYVGDTGDGYHEICDINDTLGHRVEVDPETVGQYTGCKDCGLDKIFEGDRVEDVVFDQGTVYWDEEDACFALKMDDGTIYTFGDLNTISLTVIGNIHDQEVKE